jgi:hypothetical protein
MYQIPKPTRLKGIDSMTSKIPVLKSKYIIPPELKKLDHVKPERVDKFAK